MAETHLETLCCAFTNRGVVLNDFALAQLFDFLRVKMEGTIKRITDKGFGFISDGSDKDMFFHSSSVEGVSFDELREGQRVTFEVGSGPKGPRAENVQLLED